MYCRKCGVELEKNRLECPLCKCSVIKIEEENNIGEEEKEYPNVHINLYKIKVEKLKKSIFLSFVTMSLISILEIFFQNILVYKKLTWGYYAIISILLFDIILLVLVRFYKMRTNLFILLISVSAFLLCVDIRKDNNLTWSMDIGIPIVINYYVILLIFSYVLKIYKKDNMKIVNIFLFLIGISLLILEYIINKKFSWSIWASVPLFVLSTMLKYIYNNYKDEFDRRLHI